MGTRNRRDLCGRLWWQSFLGLILQDRVGAWPHCPPPGGHTDLLFLAPPPGSATVIRLRAVSEQPKQTSKVRVPILTQFSIILNLFIGSKLPFCTSKHLKLFALPAKLKELLRVLKCPRCRKWSLSFNFLF